LASISVSVVLPMPLGPSNVTSIEDSFFMGSKILHPVKVARLFLT